MAALRYPWEAEPVPVAPSPLPDPEEPLRKRRGRRAAACIHPASPVAPTPQWLYHHLTISGPAETVAAFAVAARGSGVVPWQLDFAAIEEAVFIRAVAQPAGRRNLTIEGCRILARQFREKIEARQARATEHAREGPALLRRSHACLFDLHTLLPVPPAILQLGPTDPEARSWLAAHWGITDRLRQVVARAQLGIGRRLAKNHTAIGYGFFTDGETPHRAIAQLGARWPALRFVLVPRPDA
jgi:hypothetical protein